MSDTIPEFLRIAKMKAKMSTGKVDPKTHRWDQRLGKFVPLEPWEMKKVAPVVKIVRPGVTEIYSGPRTGDLELVTKDNAERIAKLNGVWKDSYGDLQAGLMTMSVKNRLKRLVKEGRAIIFE